MKRLNNCCCFTARTGAMILAILGIIGGLMNTFSNGIGMSAEPGMQEMLENQKDQFTELYHNGEISQAQYEYMVNYLSALQQGLPYILVIGLVTGIFNLLVHSCLLCGIVYKRAGLLLPWLIIQMIELVLVTIGVAGVTILLWVYGAVGGGFIFLLFATGFLALGFYLWHVVQSVYADIKEQGDDYNEQPIVMLEAPPAYDQLK